MFRYRSTHPKVYSASASRCTGSNIRASAGAMDPMEMVFFFEFWTEDVGG